MIMSLDTNVSLAIIVHKASHKVQSVPRGHTVMPMVWKVKQNVHPVRRESTVKTKV